MKTDSYPRFLKSECYLNLCAQHSGGANIHIKSASHLGSPSPTCIQPGLTGLNSQATVASTTKIANNPIPFLESNLSVSTRLAFSCSSLAVLPNELEEGATPSLELQDRSCSSWRNSKCSIDAYVTGSNSYSHDEPLDCHIHTSSYNQQIPISHSGGWALLRQRFFSRHARKAKSATISRRPTTFTRHRISYHDRSPDLESHSPTEEAGATSMLTPLIVTMASTVDCWPSIDRHNHIDSNATCCVANYPCSEMELTKTLMPTSAVADIKMVKEPDCPNCKTRAFKNLNYNQHHPHKPHHFYSRYHLRPDVTQGILSFAAESTPLRRPLMQRNDTENVSPLPETRPYHNDSTPRMKGMSFF
ncbi:unnamed protein product [Protopolystoma xenopodis]|uniref:RGS domain-containing protein n=1 Tax=Protopolystoma xenopodis TaxID=117903 RepID=A0A448WS52_9PLAT|nr:unnamed protein product [Protopolystoma xenopodis]